jgi:hypothetical protein
MRVPSIQANTGRNRRWKSISDHIFRVKLELIHSPRARVVKISEDADLFASSRIGDFYCFIAPLVKEMCVRELARRDRMKKSR